MKKYFYLFTISISLISCYTYRTSAEKDTKSKKAISKTQVAIAKKEMANSQASSAARDARNNREAPRRASENTQSPRPTNIQEILDNNKYFKIDVADRSYKIQVDKWENDTLVAHVIHRPKKILKFHRNQINKEKIAERHFSQPVADILTVTAYAGIGVGIWALVQ